MLLANCVLLLFSDTFIVAICVVCLLLAFAMPLSDVHLIVDVLRYGFCCVVSVCSCFFCFVFCVFAMFVVCCVLFAFACCVCFCLCLCLCVDFAFAVTF